MAQKRRVKRHNAYFSKNYFEDAAWEAQQVVCGIDEVGRGCLAGPVVTAAVILPIGTKYPLLQDSKVLSEKDRITAHRWIVQNCQYAYGMVNHRMIDTHNIYQATLIGMKRALLQLLHGSNFAPKAILVDAMPLHLAHTKYAHIPVHSFPHGETLSTSIAAASIIAKVKRDALMHSFDQFFPGYQLGQHKGYATAIHQELLLQAQPSIIHRITFVETVFHSQNNREKGQQISFF